MILQVPFWLWNFSILLSCFCLTFLGKEQPWHCVPKREEMKNGKSSECSYHQTQYEWNTLMLNVTIVQEKG